MYSAVDNALIIAYFIISDFDIKMSVLNNLLTL